MAAQAVLAKAALSVAAMMNDQLARFMISLCGSFAVGGADGADPGRWTSWLRGTWTRSAPAMPWQGEPRRDDVGPGSESALTGRAWLGLEGTRPLNRKLQRHGQHGHRGRAQRRARPAQGPRRRGGVWSAGEVYGCLQKLAPASAASTRLRSTSRRPGGTRFRLAWRRCPWDERLLSDAGKNLELIHLSKEIMQAECRLRLAHG